VKIAAAALDALVPLPTKRALPALTCPVPTHRFLPLDGSINRALNVVSRLYLGGIAKMAQSYKETTLQQFKDQLTEKLTQPGGTNITELTQTVDGVYSFADERRAGLIAKTESFRAVNWANQEAWRASGVVQTVKWYTSEQDNVCEYCHPRHAEIHNPGARPSVQGQGPRLPDHQV
jgi:hypothetical protein